MYTKFFKRFIDIVLSLVGIVILSPLMLVAFILISIEDPGEVVFVQDRVGKNKKIFHLYKFRSMRKDAPRDLPTHLFQNPDQYMLKCGHFLRHSSIDELPQLINILKGDMSIIGPRPALWNQDDLIAERDKYGANDVRPGLTGWAQIHGRDELSIEDKAYYDGEYCKNMGFKMDIRCFFMTISKVIHGEGIVDGNTNGKDKK